MVAVDLTTKLIIPEGLRSILQDESSLRHLGISLWLCELIEACQHSMEHPSVHDLRAWQICMDPRSWCVAAGDYSARYVCSVVLDSRMWCPHDIGRDSWVWGEQGTLEMMNSPTKWGMSRSPREAPCREETGWPVGMMIVVVVVAVVCFSSWEFRN